MAVGARDYIDKLLVKKYADEKVDNHEALESMVDPQKMLEAMNDVAMIQRNMFAQPVGASCLIYLSRTASKPTRTLIITVINPIAEISLKGITL